MSLSTTPTGREHETPVKIRDTSATERSTFRTCRRQWLLGTVHRLGSIEGHDAFLFGTAVHAGLAAYYIARRDRPRSLAKAEDGGHDAYEADWANALEGLEDSLGFLWQQYRPGYDEMGDMGTAMLEGYFDRERRQPLGRPLTVEERFEVPIVGHRGRTIGYLSCQLDLTAERERSGDEVIVDHKTASQKPNSGQLDLDDQLTAYVWARERHTGQWIREAIYNVLLKKAPKPPRMLKSGKLSQDRSQATTWDLYMEAIEEHGLSADDYSDHLAWLAEEGPTFFWREGVFRTKGQLAGFERNLYHEMVDMRRVAARPETAYPNPSPFKCPSCPVRQICATMMDGDDVETVIRDNYVVLPPRR